VTVAHQRVHQRQKDLDDPGLVPGPVDLLGGELRVLRRHHERPPEAAIVRQPDLAQPPVVGGRDGRGRVRIHQRADAEDIASDQDRAVDPAAVQQLPDHELRVRSGHRAVLGEGIPAHRADRVDVHVVLGQRQLRRVHLGRPTRLGQAAEQPAPPCHREVRAERPQALRQVRVDVAIDRPQRGLRAVLLGIRHLRRRHLVSPFVR